MKIQENISTSDRKYYQVNSGDIFEFQGCLYINLRSDNTSLNNEFSARLSDGCVRKFNESDDVILRKDVKVVSG